MKRVIFLSLISLATACQVIAQEGRHHAPSAVRHSFQRDYPEAGNAQWSQNNGQWSASFTDRSPDDRGEMVAHYDRYGSHVDSHIPYDRNDVPQAVVERTRSRYPDARDENYTRIERPRGEALFQVNLHERGRHRRIYMDDNGRERKYYDQH